MAVYRNGNCLHSGTERDHWSKLHCCLHSGASFASTALPPCFLPWGRALTWKLKQKEFKIYLIQCKSLTLAFSWGSSFKLFVSTAPVSVSCTWRVDWEYYREFVTKTNLDNISKHCWLLLGFFIAIFYNITNRRRVLLVFDSDVIDGGRRSHPINIKARLFPWYHLGTY